MSRRERAGDDDVELEDDDAEEGDDAEGDDDAEGEDLEGGEGAEAQAPHVPESRLAFVEAAPGAGAAPAQVARAVGSWLPFEDDRVGYVLVYRAGQGGSYIARLVRPFPTEPLETWLGRVYGAGRYRLLERGNPPGREYIGSLTVSAAEIGAGPTNGNGNGNGNGHQNGTVSVPAAAPYAGPLDYRLALVTTGLPLLAGVLGEFAKAISARPQRSELDTILAAAKLLQTPNEERSNLFREGIKLAREMEPARESPGESLFNVRDILSGLGDVVKAWRESRPAAPPAAAPGGAPPASAAAAPTSPAGDLQAQPGETPQTFVERALVMEIRRAVGSADTPETLVVLISSWLPAAVVTYLETAPEDEILATLPTQFPAHADYLREPEVQRFLRSAITMMHEDAAADDGGDERVREPAAAGA